MPDPVLLLEAAGAAAGASAACLLILARPGTTASPARIDASVIVAMMAGLVFGYGVLQQRPAWPPASALDRFLTIVLPVVIVLELVAAWRTVPRRLVWLLRFGLSLAAARILLHASVYLVGPRNEWTAGHAVSVLALCGVLLAAEWALLGWLSHRRPGATLPLALALSIQSGGIAVMLAGYLAGGEAAVVPAAVLAGVAVTSKFWSGRSEGRGAIGIGLIALFSLLFIGRFFGGLTTERALALLLAPLLCWVAELPPLRRRRRLAAGLSLLLVALWLGVVLAGAKREFDLKMGTLLAESAATSPHDVRPACMELAARLEALRSRSRTRPERS